MEAAGRSTLLNVDSVFPDLHRVVFRTATEFEQVAERFLSDDRMREDVRRRFTRVVRAKYTYPAVLGGILKQMRAALRASPDLVEA